MLALTGGSSLLLLSGQCFKMGRGVGRHVVVTKVGRGVIVIIADSLYCRVSVFKVTGLFYGHRSENHVAGHMGLACLMSLKIVSSM